MDDTSLQLNKCNTEAETKENKRSQWAKKAEYFLAVAGNIVGLGNVWRFPYLCYKNGGALGQYTRKSGIISWRNICPLFEGIGYAGLMIIIYTAIMYIIILAWALFYLFHSFSKVLPWASCSNTWNTASLIPNGSESDTGQYILRQVKQQRLLLLESIFRDCIHLCLLNSGTSILAGFAVFSTLGFMAYEQGVPIDEVAESGPGLIFIVYPYAISMMPLPQLWTFCLFLMIFLLGLDTQFTILEIIMATTKDMFAHLLQKERRLQCLLLFICISLYILELPMISEGGVYIFQIIDYYGCSGRCFLFIAIFQSICIGWVYGEQVEKQSFPPKDS
ncbi:S6A13 protein, partial [Polypterus senegalus]